MAADDKGMKKRWLKRKEAERKVRGEAVKVKTDTPPYDYDAIYKTVTQAALETVIAALPHSVRMEWAQGNAEYETVSDKHMRINIWIQHHQSGAKVNVLKEIHLPQSDDGLKGLGRLLGRQLEQGVNEWRRDKSEDWKQEFKVKLQKAAPLPGTPVIEKDDPKPPKQIGKAGPLCFACGREDRDKFPEWGTCPHGVEK